MKSKYWIEFHHYYCQYGGHDESVEQIRVYDRPKPVDYFERHIVHDIGWCYGCQYSALM